MVLETKGLTKSYNGRVVVDHVDMHIESGDVYGFVGENGAGKTTIIRLITGLAAPTEGEYSLFGIKSDDPKISEARQKICGIVEAVSVSPSMTAMENLEYQCLATGMRLSETEKRDLLAKVGLDPAAVEGKKASSFSLGMRQRLGLALTLVSKPSFIILDEPMNGLDPKGFIEVRDIITELGKEGITFLISSHILSELEKTCNKIGFLSHGRLLKELTIAELHEASKPHIALEADNLSEVEQLLSGILNLRETGIEGNELLIFDSVDINDLIRVLAQKNIRVRNLGKREESVEDYYMKLIGGAGNGQSVKN